MDKRHLKLVNSEFEPSLVLEPEIEVFLKGLRTEKSIHQMSSKDARQALEKIQGEPKDSPDIQCEEIEIDTRTHGSVKVQIYRSQKNKKKLPILLYFHGGGSMIGTARTHHRLLVDLVREVEMALVFVNYSTTLEATYPKALEQGYAVAQYFSEQADHHFLDSKRMAIAGDGVGGNMATVLSRWSVERDGPDFLIQVLFYPVTDASMNSRSYELYKKGPWLTKEAMKNFWSSYEPRADLRLEANRSPLRTDPRFLSKLPPSLIITAEHDVLRDEGEAYARLLVDAGVNVMAIRVLGTIHDFAMLNALADTEATRNVLDLTGTRLRAAFSAH